MLPHDRVKLINSLPTMLLTYYVYARSNQQVAITACLLMLLAFGNNVDIEICWSTEAEITSSNLQGTSQN